MTQEITIIFSISGRHFQYQPSIFWWRRLRSSRCCNRGYVFAFQWGSVSWQGSKQKKNKHPVDLTCITDPTILQHVKFRNALKKSLSSRLCFCRDDRVFKSPSKLLHTLPVEPYLIKRLSLYLYKLSKNLLFFFPKTVSRKRLLFSIHSFKSNVRTIEGNELSNDDGLAVVAHPR